MLKLSDVFGNTETDIVLYQYRTAENKLKIDHTEKLNSKLGITLPIVIQEVLGNNEITLTVTGLTKVVIVNDIDGEPCLQVIHNGFTANVDGSDQIACGVPGEKYFNEKYELLAFLNFLKDEFQCLQYLMGASNDNICTLATEVQKRLTVICRELTETK